MVYSKPSANKPHPPFEKCDLGEDGLILESRIVSESNHGEMPVYWV